MVSKSDVGTYTYAPPGSPLPHAVMSVSGSTISTTFSYDPNGNQTAGLGRTITWTSYNMPASITVGSQTVSFQHDVNHQRVKQITANGNTLYINAFGVTAELFGAGTAAARWTEYLMVGNVRVGMRVTDIAASTTSLRYFHTDHLGSVAVITNEAAVVVERLSYDAWGKRRYPNGADDPTGSITSQTSRGFTGHEELDSVSLVHMNGRLYDALMGRMISADPTVPDPMNAQAWNRYSYVGNDPLAFTDPSGFSWLSNFFSGAGNFFGKIFSPAILRSIAQLVITTVLTPIIGPVLAAAAGAAIITGLSGGNLGQMLRAAAIAAWTAGAFQGLSEFIEGPAMEGASQAARYMTNVAGSAAIGCLSAAASGGSCKSGALAAGVTATASPLISKIPAGAGRLAASSLVGGLASVAGGGKFENGAVTGAFQYMFGPKAREEAESGDARTRALAFNPAAAEEADADLLREALEQNRTATMISGGVGLAGIAAAGALGTLGGAVAVDHIVLGISDYGVGDLAASIGGRTLLSDPNWRIALMEALGNASTRFTVSLDGFAGANTVEQVMSAVGRGLGSAAQATEWEMGQLFQAGRLGSTTFMRGGRVVPNPF